jgi:hypothetical protein
MLKTFVSVFLAGSFLINPALASEQSKKARNGDLATSYELDLDKDGTLTRLINGRRCTVTNKVQDFKISEHPNDTAMIYFVKQNKESGRDDLWILKNSESKPDGNCPKASSVRIMPNLKRNGEFKYKVVSSTNTKIVNLALSNNGNLVAWGNDEKLFEVQNISDFSMNQCNDRKGYAFQKYVAFGKDRFSGRILKIDGDRPQGPQFTPEGESYMDIKDFKKKQRVCEEPKQEHEKSMGLNFDQDRQNSFLPF